MRKERDELRGRGTSLAITKPDSNKNPE